jgi:hypothetical protein
MKRFLHKITALLVFFQTLSCNSSQENNTEVISIDFDKIKPVDIRDTSQVKILPLEATDFSLLEEIRSVDFIEDKILIFSSNKVFTFDRQGKFLFNIGRKGAGQGEYVRITGFFVKEKKIFLFDDVLQKLLIYNEKGEWLSSSAVNSDEGISIIYPLQNGGYAALNKYRGENNQTPTVCLFDEALKKTHDIKSRTLQSGEIVYDNFSSFGNSILYWEFLNDTIFSINQQKELFPKYYVDFGEYKIPNDKSSEELIEYVNNSVNPKMATCIKYIQEDATCIRFIFLQKEAIINCVIYNKENKTAEVLRFTDSENELSPQLFMLYKDGCIITSVLNINDFDDNPKLAFINLH